MCRPLTSFHPNTPLPPQAQDSPSWPTSPHSLMCLHQACSKSPRWSLQYFPTWNAIFLVPWGSLGHVPAHTPVKPSSFGISSASSIVFSCCCRDKTPCRINIMAPGVKGCHPPCSEGVACMSWEEHMTWLLLPHTDQEVESQTLSRSGSGSKVLPLLVFRRQILNLPKQLHLLGTEYSKPKPAGTFQLQPLTCAFDMPLGLLVLSP